MLQLLKIEWMKLRHYRTFWVLMIMYLVSVFAANYVGFSIEQRTIAKEQMLKAIAGTSFGYPDLWQTVCFISSFLVFIPALLIITFVANEFTYKTHRQNVIDGWSRQQFITVKILIALLMSVLATLMVLVTVVIIGLLSGTGFSWEGSIYLIYFFIQSFSYCCLALLAAVLIKRTGLALGIFLLYAFVLENFIGGLLNWQIKSKPGNYLPLNSTDSLIPFPFIKNVSKQFLDKPNLSLLLILVGVYLVAYLFIVIRRFQRADL